MKFIFYNKLKVFNILKKMLFARGRVVGYKIFRFLHRFVCVCQYDFYSNDKILRQPGILAFGTGYGYNLT
jgi:hypothetical protein